MKKTMVVIAGATLVILLTLTGSIFAEDTVVNLDKNRACVDRFLDKAKTLPEKEFIETLDGRKISIEELNFYNRIGSSTNTPYKFYYWIFDIQKIQYGGKQYLAKRYWNPMSACYGRPENRMYGDVAELYEISKKGKISFLAFAILVMDDGKEGIYITINYQKKKIPKIDM